MFECDSGCEGFHTDRQVCVCPMKYRKLQPLVGGIKSWKPQPAPVSGSSVMAEDAIPSADLPDPKNQSS